MDPRFVDSHYLKNKWNDERIEPSNSQLLLLLRFTAIRALYKFNDFYALSMSFIFFDSSLNHVSDFISELSVIRIIFIDRGSTILLYWSIWIPIESFFLNLIVDKRLRLLELGQFYKWSAYDSGFKVIRK